MYTQKGFVCLQMSGTGVLGDLCAPQELDRLAVRGSFLPTWCVCMYLQHAGLCVDQTQRGTGLKLFVLLVQVLCFLAVLVLTGIELIFPV